MDKSKGQVSNIGDQGREGGTGCVLKKIWSADHFVLDANDGSISGGHGRTRSE